PTLSGPVTVNVSDGIVMVSKTFNLVVNNVAPSFTLPASVTLTLADAGVFSIPSTSFTDPGTDVWTGTVNYGAGTRPLVINAAAKTFALAPTFGPGGPYTVTVTLNDQDGGTLTRTMTVSVPAAPVPTVAYVDDAWAGFTNGQAIADADPVATSDQAAV